MAQVLMIGHSVLMFLRIHFISAPKIDIFYELRPNLCQTSLVS